ncbi:MAG: hypothetical protein ACSHXD_16765 [Marinosulfonomonas sp.]
MKRILTSSLLAISLTFSGISAAPVYAEGSDDLAKVAFGALAFFTLVNILDKDKDSNVSQAKRPYWPSVPPKQTPPKKKAKKKWANQPNVLPKRCFFSVKGRHGTKGYYGKKCLKTRSAQVKALPNACQKTIPIQYGKPAKVYDAECLYYSGYRVANRH